MKKVYIPLTEETEKYIRENYHNTSLRNLARHLDVSEYKVLGWANEMGIPKRKRGCQILEKPTEVVEGNFNPQAHDNWIM